MTVAKIITLKNIKDNRGRIIITGIFVCVVLALSALIAALNIGYSANLSEKDYSTENMLSHLVAISEKEHSVYDEEALGEVRSYISSALFSCGVENEIIEHGEVFLFNERQQRPEPYKPKNIYAEISGSSGINVLLVAHYDSCGYKIKYGEPSEGSHGALDDGYGVAALLEIARLYSAQDGLVNGLKLAFVDAEEEGVLGSAALVNEYAYWLDDVNLVINVEGRGNKGPLYLFQTSENNSQIIDFYKNAGFPYSFSVAADVYGMLPNDTDLSPFLEKGFAGMNFAVLDSLKVYHNEKDCFDSVDEKSLSGYMNTLLPLLDEYALNSRYGDLKYFQDGHDTLFFTLLPNVLISYGAVTGWVFFGIIIVLVCALTALSVIKKRVNLKKLLLSLCVDLLCVIVICGLGFAVAAFSSLCAGVNYHVMFVIGVAFDGGITVIFALLACAAFTLSTLFKLRLNINFSEMTCGGLIINALLAVVCAAALFGGTFLFVIPVLLYSLGEGVKLFVKNDRVATYIYIALCALSTVFTLSLYVSLIYSLYVSLTFGALGIIAVFAVLPLTMCVPQTFNLFGATACGAQKEAV